MVILAVLMDCSDIASSTIVSCNRRWRYVIQKGVLFEHFRSLTEGMKELMLHRGRRETFVEEISGKQPTRCGVIT